MKAKEDETSKNSGDAKGRNIDKCKIKEYYKANKNKIKAAKKAYRKSKKI